MHLSVRHSQILEDAETPVNPHQSPADMLVLSFTDSDLACMAAASRAKNIPSLRLTSIAPMKHPLSIDLYIEQVAAHAKIIIVRLLGGYEWWKYGVEELHKIAISHGIKLVIVSGSGHDPRLLKFSTLPKNMVIAVENCLAQGGAENAARVLEAMQALLQGHDAAPPVPEMIENGFLYKAPVLDKLSFPRRRESSAANAYGICSPGSQVKPGMTIISLKEEGEWLGKATIIFYRAHYLAADTAPVDAMIAALTERGFNVRAFMVTSLKDEKALAALRAEVEAHRPDIIIDFTAFSAGSGAHPLAFCNVPILQCALANCSVSAWEESKRGLATTDLAMHVVLPEADGVVFTRAISFKKESGADELLEFTRLTHQPEIGRVDYVAGLCASWLNLAKKPANERKLAIILSDYPDRSGRSAYAVGLDAPASANEVLKILKEAGYSVTQKAAPGGSYDIADYKARFALLPPENRQAVIEAWGEPEEDEFFADSWFNFSISSYGNVLTALQPDRGSLTDKKSGYHDAVMPPRHGYLAFYWWLRDVAGIDALIHLGTHGNLEWLPGKSAALSDKCWPEIALGAMPVIYPYIVSDPGEAAQAKRRISAVMLSHLTPPLMDVELSPELASLETLVDEYSSADGLDSRRMKLLREEIIYQAKKSGLSFAGSDDMAVMSALEAHLCDIKEQRVGNGLHIFGASSPVAASGQAWGSDIAEKCAENERKNLLAALNGGFVMPSSGGSPVRGRLDILPTGRNLVAVDPRMIPTPTATAIGKRAAGEFVSRYVQDHGDYPANIVIDVWGSATLRNGGDEIAQALCLMGVTPLWDNESHRVTGFEVVPGSEMQWPRIDVCLRISGMFRDMFPNLILLFDDAVQAVTKLQGKRKGPRIFGNAPNAYGAGTAGLIDSGSWKQRGDLGQAYINASQFAYGRGADGELQPVMLKERIASADALIHVQDAREMDVLSGADFADSEGGFSAAANMLGAMPALYHIDTSRPDSIKTRTLAEEISLTLHSRAVNPKWIEGQMRHGYAGGAALADVVDNLFAFAAASNTVTSAQFEAVAESYLHDEKVLKFLEQENPDALKAIRSRLNEALERGLWQPLRNSTGELLRIHN